MRLVIESRWSRPLASLMALVVFFCFASLTAYGQNPDTQSKPPASDEKKAEPTKDGEKKEAEAKDGQKKDARRTGAVVRPGASDGIVGPPIARQAFGTKREEPAGPQPTVILKPGEIPMIAFDTPEYDFGTVKAGADIVHDFFFTNEGTGPLEILRVKPSCGCTTAGEHTKIVKPGETGKIPIKLGTAKFSGPVTKTVHVSTNVPGPDGDITLKIKGEVWQAIQVSPQNASFARLSMDEALAAPSVRLTIQNNSDTPMKIGSVTPSTPAFRGEIVTIEDGKRYELVVSLVPPLQTGSNYGKIDVETGVADMPTLSVPVSVYVTSVIDVSPSKLILRPGRTAPLQRQFFIRTNGAATLAITDLKATNEKIALSLLESQPGKQYRLQVDIPADYEPAADGDLITFKTGNDKMPEIQIPIQGTTPVRSTVTRTFSSKPTPAPADKGDEPAAKPVAPATPSEPTKSQEN